MEVRVLAVIDPQDPRLLVLEGVYLAIGVAFLLAAYKSKSEWTKVGLAGFGLSLIAWRLLAVIPSFWLYYADTKLNWGGNGCTSLSNGTDAIKCLKQTARDVIVVGELSIGFTAMIIAFARYQKKFPKQLASGESKPEATGGYK